MKLKQVFEVKADDYSHEEHQNEVRRLNNKSKESRMAKRSRAWHKKNPLPPEPHGPRRPKKEATS